MSLEAYSCPICGSRCELEIFEHAALPLHNLQKYFTREEAIGASSRSVLFMGCEQCGFVFNARYSSAGMYDAIDYESSRVASPAFSGYLDSVIDFALSRLRRTEGRIVEVGCGSGDFLTRLCARGDFEGFGFDVNANLPACSESASVQFFNEYYRREEFY
ncbi:MAG: hypothetical protein KDD44_13700, partial [Bdellovibrionales bacterium]|nr:hypothetical protein [Bdellovibrionales bacterium]